MSDSKPKTAEDFPGNNGEEMSENCIPFNREPGGDNVKGKGLDGPPWLPELIKILGWQGGTIHQALDEVKKLKTAPTPEAVGLVVKFSVESDRGQWWLMYGTDGQVLHPKDDKFAEKKTRQTAEWLNSLAAHQSKGGAERDFTPEEALKIMRTCFNEMYSEINFETGVSTYTFQSKTISGKEWSGE